MEAFCLKINGIKTHFYTWGKRGRPKLFLFHGWMDTGASFEFVCQSLSQHYFCIAPDFRGFGRSGHTRHPLGYFFYEYIADLNEMFHQIAPREKIKMLGHSMGGHVASLYAGTFPKKVSHLINVEGFGLFDMPAEHGPLRMQQWIEAKGKDRANQYRSIASVANRLREKNPRLDKGRALFIAKHQVKKVGSVYQPRSDPKHKWVQPYLFKIHNMFAFWEKITAECLLIYGEHTEMDKWFKNQKQGFREMRRRLKKFPTDSKVVKIPKAGHMVHHENPEALSQAVSTFFRDP